MIRYKCPKCDAISTAEAWDTKTHDHYGEGCVSVTDVSCPAYYDCPACSAEWIPRGDIAEVADTPYDTERGVIWHVVLYAEHHSGSLHLPEVSSEITPESAAALAIERGYGYFEIVRTLTEIKRYAVAEEAEE